MFHVKPCIFFLKHFLCTRYTIILHLLSYQQKQRDRQLERKKCLARDLSDLIVYAVAVPFDIDSKYIVGFV